MISQLLNFLPQSLMYWLMDEWLDDCWRPYAGHRSQAQSLAFYLAYVVIWDNPSEDEPTIASKPKVNLPTIKISWRKYQLSF